MGWLVPREEKHTHTLHARHGEGEEANGRHSDRPNKPILYIQTE